MTIESNSIESCLMEDNMEKDRRRINLLNDPNYGIVLCFLDKFRSILDLPNYPLQRFEDHLVNYQEPNSSRLIDFHFILLKRLSLAKNAQRDKFDSIITKFASRFDVNDSEHLTTTGYLQADINIKIRIIKNLLESQFDLNQTLKNTLIDKTSYEIKSLPLGRDRFGVSYWFFMDNDCFVRLFREDVDIDRTWTNIAKNRDELEKFIKLLITDYVVRKRFPNWTIDYEQFSSLLPSNEFEKYYSPTSMNIKEEEIETIPTNDENSDVPIKRKRGRPKSSKKSLNNQTNTSEIELTSNNNEKSNVSMKKKRGRPKGSTKLSKKKIDIETKQEIEPMFNDDTKSNLPIKRKVTRRRSSTTLSSNKIDVEIKEEGKILVHRGRKRNLTVEENNNDKKFKINEDQNQQEEISIDDISLSIRRSLRLRQAPTIESTSIVSSKTISQLSDGKKKDSMNSKTKDLRSYHRRKTTFRRNLNNYLSSSTSSSDEYDSDDYLSNQSEIDINDNLFEFEEDNNTNNEQLHTAKTAQTLTIITACCVCSKNDRPEVLLLCDDCDDAYHLECLRPILLSIPDSDWFCPLCEHKNLSNYLIKKLKELLINYNISEMKLSKKSLQRKIKIKEYNSDESITASESEHEHLENLTNDEESILSTNQINEYSNLSSSYFDDISQRGRHRRTRFNMKKILNNHNEFNDNSDSNDVNDKYINFNLQLPKKMTRLLHRRNRSSIKNDQPIKTLPTRLYDTSIDLNDMTELNEKLGSPLVYVNGDGNSRQMKSVITNAKQTLKIVRRWNDVQRRSRLKTTIIKKLNQTTTSDCADENSIFYPDDTSLPHSNDSNSNNGIRNEDSTIIQPSNLIPIDKFSSRNIVKKSDANFDRLIRDIQFAVSEAHLLPIKGTTTTKTTDQQHVKRIQKTIFSPYTTKLPLRSFPLSLPKPSSNAYDIFKSTDSSTASSLSLLHATDDQTTPMMNT